MVYSQLVRGHVGGVARDINFPNAQPEQAGLASANPIFTWVRLAQRVPARIHIDQVPDGVLPVAGMTATVRIDPRPAPGPSVAAPPGALHHDRGNSRSGESSRTSASTPQERWIELQLHYVRITWTAEKRRSYQARYEHPVLITGLCKWWCWPASKIQNIP
jgi:hypothetical protein